MSKLEIYKLNYELSLDVYNKFQDLIEMQECYYNVAQIIMRRFDEITDMLPNVAIAYGAWQSFDNIYAKHCFFIMDGEIIDPTYFATNTENDYRNYLVFKTYDIPSYLFALVEQK